MAGDGDLLRSPFSNRPFVRWGKKRQASPPIAFSPRYRTLGRLLPRADTDGGEEKVIAVKYGDIIDAPACSSVHEDTLLKSAARKRVALERIEFFG